MPDEILQPALYWKDIGAYNAKASKLAFLFMDNFKKYHDRASEEIIRAGPKLDGVDPIKDFTGPAKWAAAPG